MKLNNRQHLGSLLLPLACPAVLLAAWEIIGRVRFHIAPVLAAVGFERSLIPDFSFLLPLSEILPKLVWLFISGEIYPFLWDTAWRSTVGFAIAALLGVTIGIPLGLSRRSERLFLPTVDALRTVPPVALLPVIILFFGIDHAMKIAFIFIGGIWPVVINTAHAVKSVDPMYLKVAYNSGYKPRSILRRVILPASMPGIFTGLKISLSISVILSIVGEMMIGNSGLGFFLNYSKRNFDYDEMFAAILIIAVLGWLMNLAIHRIDRHILAWYYRNHEVQMEYHHPWEA